MRETEPGPTTEDTEGHGGWFYWARAVVSVALGIIGGWLTWKLSPMFTGEVEPWDSGAFYFAPSTLGVALIAGLFWPDRWWASAISVVGGQLVYCAFFYEVAGPVILPGFIAVPLFAGPPALAGAILAMFLSHVVIGMKESQEPTASSP